MLYNVLFETLLIPVVEVFRSGCVCRRARVHDLDKVVSALFAWGASNKYRDGCLRIQSDAID